MTSLNNNHNANLLSFCFVCGRQCNSFERKSAVDDFKKELIDIFFLEESSFNENTPSYFCLVCHARMGNMKRPTSTTKVILPKWEPHSSEKCSVCELQTPPSAKVGRKPKQKAGKKGRPSLNSVPVWTRGDINSILNQIGSTPSIPCDLKLKLNDRIGDIFQCDLCKGIMNYPIANTKCKHTFCHTCFCPKIIGSNIQDTTCPACLVNISPEVVHLSQPILHALRSHNISCNRCQQLFPIFTKFLITRKSALQLQKSLMFSN